MQKTEGIITENFGDYKIENALFTYDENEKQENTINKNNANLVLTPKFIPLYPKLLQNGYGLVESILFGFIEFFLSNNDKFYCTNEQLADLLNCSEKTISTAIKSLENRGDIVIHKKMRAGGGTVRFITLGNVNFTLWEMQKVHGIDNKIIENKNNIIINNNTEQSSEHLNNSLSLNKNGVLEEKEKSSAKKEKEELTEKINKLILTIKGVCMHLGIMYDKTMERQFAKHILTAKEFGDNAELCGMDRITFAINIINASEQIKYWKGTCNGPKSIYQNYVEVYNQTKQKHQKTFTPTINVL